MSTGFLSLKTVVILYFLAAPVSLTLTIRLFWLIKKKKIPSYWDFAGGLLLFLIALYFLVFFA